MGDATMQALQSGQFGQGIGHFGNALTQFGNAFSAPQFRQPLPFDPRAILQQRFMEQQVAAAQRLADREKAEEARFTNFFTPQVEGLGYDPTATGARAPAQALGLGSAQAEFYRAMGPDKGLPALASLMAAQANRSQFVSTEMGGMPGQVDVKTGEFKPFSPNLTGKWEPETRGGVAGQRNTFTNEWKPLDPALSKVQVNPNINLPPQETEERKVVGKHYGEQFTEIQKAGFNAQANNAKLDALGKALEGAYTGTGGQTVLAAKKAAKALGIDVEGVPEAEAANAISREMALQLRNPAGGAGMPGAMSDADREFLVSMVPGLSTTREGNQLLIDYQKRVNTRTAEVAKLAREYRKEKGSLDEGFYDKLAEHSAKNPLFKEEDFKKAQAIAGNPKIMDEARDAIKRGAPRDKVIERLRSMGIDPKGL